MATAAQIATRLANDILGITTYTNLAAGTSKLIVKSLLDLVSLQGTMTQRGHLDQMSPQAHIQLVAELTAMYNFIAN